MADADFVQESAPERLELKQQLYEKLGRLVPADIVIASSTSGLMMTDVQALCSSPERTVIGHPFNPPYLLPLVEIIGGKRTDPAAVTWVRDFYARAGKAPPARKAPARKAAAKANGKIRGIGISTYPADAGDGEGVLRNADVAMYRAKQLGRNNYRFYGR